MEQVLQCYGKGIAAGIVLIAVMVLLFAGIRDEQGNRRSFPDKFRETGTFADMGVFCYSIKDSLLPRKQKSFRRP